RQADYLDDARRLLALYEIEQQRHVGKLRFLLEADLHEDVDPVLGEPALVRGLHARPAISPTAHDLATLHREMNLRGSGIAVDWLEFRPQQLVDDGDEDEGIGRGADGAHRDFAELGVFERP